MICCVLHKAKFCNELATWLANFTTQFEFAPTLALKKKVRVCFPLRHFQSAHGPVLHTTMRRMLHRICCRLVSSSLIEKLVFFQIKYTAHVHIVCWILYRQLVNDQLYYT